MPTHRSSESHSSRKLEKLASEPPEPPEWEEMHDVPRRCLGDYMGNAHLLRQPRTQTKAQQTPLDPSTPTSETPNCLPSSSEFHWMPDFHAGLTHRKEHQGCLLTGRTTHHSGMTGW